MDDNKQKALNLAISQIEKNYGKGSIMKLGDVPNIDVNTLPSGALSLDIALGVGGYPRGRIIEIFGPEASGKTTLSLHAVAEAQKKGGICAYIDVENSLDPNYAQKIGVKTNDLLLSQPDYAEQALEITETLVRSGSIDVVVIDSVAALVPKAEIEGEMIDVQMGAQARLMSKALRKLTAAINKSKTIVIFVNQIREKIGFVLGNPEVTPGGKALKFYASIRLEVRRIESIKNGVDIIGNKVRIKLVKNKVAPPFKRTEVEIIFGQGISKIADILDLATEFDLIEKSGTWYAYQNERMGQGKEAAKAYLSKNKELCLKLAKEIKEKITSNKKEA
ncbi:recombinase RecA [bacterium]|nr:recombinase RecA [bacterium]MBT3581233.1 recombinase RecA [bacterium]MBT4552352.1 recombinase RecA [bacterium]MBT7088075.1 recombinase RecA [bacterium]